MEVNEYIGMAIDGNLAEQAKSESLHIAFLAVSSGASLFMGLIGALLRRDIKRSDEERCAMAASILELGKKIDANKDRIGYEISDIKIAVAPLFTKAELEQPNYPSR